VSKASEAPTVELLLGIGKHMHCDQKFKKEKLKLKLKPKKKGGVGRAQSILEFYTVQKTAVSMHAASTEVKS
jgi:hypothetical protein